MNRIAAITTIPISLPIRRPPCKLRADGPRQEAMTMKSAYAAATRLERIRRHLESGGCLNTSDIANEHNVSRRTGLRDIQFLREVAKMPIYYDSSHKVFELEKKETAMSKRHTLYLTDTSRDILGPVENLSGRVNQVIGHYGRLTRAAAPALTEGQWGLLCDMLNGTFIEDNTGDYLWADIAESGKLDGLAEKWGVDTAAFSQQVRDMTPAARFYILDVVVRFWKTPRPENHDLTMRQMLEQAGAMFAP